MQVCLQPQKNIHCISSNAWQKIHFISAYSIILACHAENYTNFIHFLWVATNVWKHGFRHQQSPARSTSKQHFSSELIGILCKHAKFDYSDLILNCLKLHYSNSQDVLHQRLHGTPHIKGKCLVRIQNYKWIQK